MVKYQGLKRLLILTLNYFYPFLIEPSNIIRLSGLYGWDLGGWHELPCVLRCPRKVPRKQVARSTSVQCKTLKHWQPAIKYVINIKHKNKNLSDYNFKKKKVFSNVCQ